MQVKKTELLEKFAVRLKAAMKRRGVTLQEVATHCEVGVSTVGAWSQAKNWPQVEVQPALAAFLQTSVHFLIHGIPEKMENAQYPEVGAKAAPAVHEEEQAPYGTPAEIERRFRRDFDATVAAAEGDVQRLHWIAEQTKLHLSVPKSWRRRSRDLGVDVVLPSQNQQVSLAPNPSHLARPA